jgi:hypothetical protein
MEGFVGYHQLMPFEFRVNDKVHPESAFWIAPLMHPHYEARYFESGISYAYVTNWHVTAGVNKNELTRKSSISDMRLILTFAQAIFDVYELHARQLNQLLPGDLPRGSGPTPVDARVNLESQLRVMLERDHDKVTNEINDLIAIAKQKDGKAKLLEQAAAIRKRMEALPVSSSSNAQPVVPPAATPSVSSSPR